MAWYVSNDDEHIRIGKERTLGRDDFVDAPVLSKNHLKFAVSKAGLMVRDLGSLNGTRLGGLVLIPNQDYPLRGGDVLSVDELNLRVEWYRPNLMILVSLIAILFGLKLLNPVAAWGTAVGRYGLVTYGLSAVLAAFGAVIFSHYVVPTRFKIGAVITAAVAAGALDYAQLTYFARHSRLVERIMRARVAHYCLDHFDGRRCVEQVNVCPKCAGRIEKWQRELIVRRLAAADQRRPVPAR